MKPPHHESVLSRAARILEAFSQDELSLTVSEIARRTGLHVSTTSRLVGELVAHGFLSRDDDRPEPSTTPSRRRRQPARGRACPGGGSRAAGRPTTPSTRAAPPPARDQLLGAVQTDPEQHQHAGVGLPRAGPWDARRRPTRRRSRGPTGPGPGRRRGRRPTASSAASPSPATTRPPSRGTAPARARSPPRTVRAGRAAAAPRRLRGLAAPRGQDLEENRLRSPVSSSTRRSLTRGAVTSTAPAAVVTVRGRWWPLRTTGRCPCPSRSAANSVMYWLTSASSAAASIRRAPSRTISSIREPDSVEPSAFTTLSTGVPSRPALRTRAYSVTIKGSFGKTPSRPGPGLIHRS